MTFPFCDQLQKLFRELKKLENTISPSTSPYLHRSRRLPVRPRGPDIVVIEFTYSVACRSVSPFVVFHSNQPSSEADASDGMTIKNSVKLSFMKSLPRHYSTAGSMVARPSNFFAFASPCVVVMRK